MLKNKELRLFLYGQTGILLLLILVTYLFSIPALIAVILTAIICVGSNLIFVWYRYQQIQELTNYLVQIQTKEQVLDIRDNAEGELSILKNEIYKMSLKLKTQAELLLQDKTYLADSISDISHQLKTPLTSMMMMVDFLEQGNLEKERQQEFIHNIALGIERMEWLVAALLKLSKLDADAVRFHLDPIDVKSLLEKAVQPLEIAFEVKQVELKLNTLEEDIIMTGDEQWLLEALTNIIKNCMEHTDAGGNVTISYSNNNLYTKILVQDTGQGIDKEDLPHIFERFYKGKNSKAGSVGIGLALSKQIITRQKGKIDVTSEVGAGTTFEIRIYR